MCNTCFNSQFKKYYPIGLNCLTYTWIFFWKSFLSHLPKKRIFSRKHSFRQWKDDSMVPAKTLIKEQSCTDPQSPIKMYNKCMLGTWVLNLSQLVTILSNIEVCGTSEFTLSLCFHNSKQKIWGTSFCLHIPSLKYFQFNSYLCFNVVVDIWAKFKPNKKIF